MLVDKCVISTGPVLLVGWHQPIRVQGLRAVDAFDRAPRAFLSTLSSISSLSNQGKVNRATKHSTATTAIILPELEISL